MNKSYIFILFSLLYMSQSFAIRGVLSEHYPDELSNSVVQILKSKNGKYKHTCSATLIDDNLILTAAHCFDDGVFDLKIKYSNKLYSVYSVSIHANYKREDLFDEDWGYVYDIKIQNDIAIIETSNDLIGSKINLAPTTFILENNSPLFISGFGQTANIFGMGSGEGVYRVSDKTYASKVTDDRVVIDDGRTGGCQGDSGGPLWGKVNEKWIQVAIVSQGDCNVQTQFERVDISRIKESEYIVKEL